MLFLLVALTGCSKDEPAKGADSPTAIQFTAGSPAMFITRSVIGDLATLKGVGFAVYAYSTEATPWATAAATAAPNFMCNQPVTWMDDHWSYTPVKYWPNDNNPADDGGAAGSRTHSYLSFFAYAPLGAAYLAPSLSTDTGAPTVTYTWGQANDLLYATPQTDLYKYDGSDDANDNGRVGDVVAFDFQHAVASVDFKVRRHASTGPAVTLKSLSVSGYYTGGTFGLGTTSWSATTGSGGPLSLHSGSDLAVTAYTEGTAQLLDSSLLIPGSSLTYTINYTVGGSEYTHEDIAITPLTLAKGSQYTIIFTIDGDAVKVDATKYTEQW